MSKWPNKYDGWWMRVNSDDGSTVGDNKKSYDFLQLYIKIDLPSKMYTVQFAGLLLRFFFIKKIVYK